MRITADNGYDQFDIHLGDTVEVNIRLCFRGGFDNPVPLVTVDLVVNGVPRPLFDVEMETANRSKKRGGAECVVCAVKGALRNGKRELHASGLKGAFVMNPGEDSVWQ